MLLLKLHQNLFFFFCLGYFFGSSFTNFLLSAERVLDGSGISVAPPARRSNRLHADVSKVLKPKAVTRTRASRMHNENASDASDDDGDVNDSEGVANDDDEDANNDDEDANNDDENANNDVENASDKDVKGETNPNTNLDIHDYDYTNNWQGNTKHKANIKSIAKVKHVVVQHQSISPPADLNVLSQDHGHSTTISNVQDETPRGRQKNRLSQANQQMHTSSHHRDEGIIF